MAASGILVEWSGTLDCKLLAYSSCKISKAGIGGPLVDLDGRVVGMNFYDKKVGTPFLLWNHILSILECFKEKRTVTEVGNDSYSSSGVPYWRRNGDDSEQLNRWPVPMAYDDPESKDNDEFDVFDMESYGFINGMKFSYS
ncbi:unnamed protein product [Urochloa humidicola]